MNIKKKILMIAVGPVLMLGVISIFFISTQVRKAVTSEIEEALKGTAAATLAAYDQNAGDYIQSTNGDIWKGSYNISKSESLVDKIKSNSGMDVTFFYGDERIMTSAKDANGDRVLGSRAGDKIVEKVLKGGEEYFSSAVSIEGELNYGYFMPVHQNYSDNQIIGTIVEEDVAFGPENMGVPTEEIWQRVAKSLESVDMTAYRYHSPNKLSGGQKQRIAIAGIMAMRPSCMVLDEATAMLDPSGRREVLEAVHRLNREEKVTVILITHHMDEAVDADRVLVMDQGQIAMDGTPKEVFSRVEELQKLELDVPQITELAWKLKQQGMPFSDGILTQEQFIRELEQILQPGGRGSEHVADSI